MIARLRLRRDRAARLRSPLRAALAALVFATGLVLAGPVEGPGPAFRSGLLSRLTLPHFAAARAAPASALPRDDLAWLASPTEMAAWGGGDVEAIRDLLRKVRDRAPGIAGDLQAYVGDRPEDPAAYAIAGLALLGEDIGDNAERSFERALDLGGDPAWLGAAIGAAYAAQGRPQAASAAYDAALERRPDLPLALRGRYRMALADDDRGAALLWAEKLAAALPVEPGELNRARVDLAGLYLRAGRPDDVIALLSPAFQGNRTPRPEPLALEAASPLIQAAQAAGRLATAERAMSVAYRLLPAARRKDLPWPVLSARLQRMQGRPGEAALLFGDLAADNPDLVAAFAPDRARAETEAGRPGVGLALLRDAWPDIGLPHRPSVLDDFAETAMAAGWPDGALDWLARRARDLPSAQGALLDGRALLSAERIEGAVARVRGILADPLAGPQAWLITAAARAWGGGRVAAAETLRNGLAEHPAAEALWLALSRLESGEARRRTLQQAVTAAPGSAALRIAKARAEFDLGAPGAAAESYASAFALMPGRARDRAAASVALVDSRGDLVMALAHARFARDAAPDAAFGADALGQALLARGDAEAAEIELRLAVERADPSDMAAYLHLARLFVLRRQPVEASGAALKALTGILAVHQRVEAEAILNAGTAVTRLETTLRALNAEGTGPALGRLIVNETDEGLTLDLAANGLPEGMATASLAPRPACAAPEIWAEAKAESIADRGLELRRTDPAAGLNRFAGVGAAVEPEQAMPDFRIVAGGIASVTATVPGRRISQMRGRAMLLRHEGMPDAAPFACAVIP